MPDGNLNVLMARQGGIDAGDPAPVRRNGLIAFNYL